MIRISCAILSALWLAALCTTEAQAGSTGGAARAGPAQRLKPNDLNSVPGGSLAVLTARTPSPSSRKVGTAYWMVAVCCILAAVLSLLFRSAGPWATTLIASGILATLLVLWTRPVWTPAAVGLPAAALAVVLAVKYRLSDHLQKPDHAEVLTFLSGLILLSTAAYIAGGVKEGWTRNLLYAALLGATLLLFLWRLKQPLVLWTVAVALTHLGMSAAQAAFTPTGAARVLISTGGVMAAVGIAAAAVRQNTLTIVLSAELVVIGAIVAAAGASGGLLNTQVGWTVAVGLPLVQIGLGLALAQKLGPETDAQGEGE